MEGIDPDSQFLIFNSQFLITSIFYSPGGGVGVEGAGALGAGVLGAGVLDAGGVPAGALPPAGALGAAGAPEPAGALDPAGPLGAGPLGAAAGAGGAVVPLTTDPVLPRCPMMARASALSMNNTAKTVVIFDSSVAPPRAPNAVWLLPPPNALAMSPPFPC